MKRIIYILPVVVAVLIAIHAWSVTSTTNTPVTAIDQTEQTATTTTENVSLPSTDATADLLPEGLLPDQTDQTLTNDTALSATSCVRSGCGGILCTDSSEATPPDASCNIQPHFACFDDAVCEVQDNGDCGWTQSDSLSACLINYLPVGI